MSPLVYWSAATLLLLAVWLYHARRRRRLRSEGYWVRDGDDAGFYVVLAMLALAAVAVWNLASRADRFSTPDAAAAGEPPAVTEPR